MNWPFGDTALLREQLAKAEVRADKAEAALTAERESRMRDVRHVLSQWLRHEKGTVLPPTAGEKAEAVEAKESQGPPPLTDIETAMMVANRQDAALIGISAEQADKDFMKNRHMFADD